MSPPQTCSSIGKQWILVSALFCFLVAAWFSPWWLFGRYFAPLDILNQMLPPWNEGVTYPKVHNHYVSDAVTQYIPYHILADRSLKQDGYIGWNPYSETGSRLDANTMALPGDWSLQLYRWFDFWTGWHLGLMGQFLIAGWGMLVFLRSRGCAPWAALAGAIAFSGNGQFAVWFFHRWALACFCWMPWALWALYGLLERCITHGRFESLTRASAWDADHNAGDAVHGMPGATSQNGEAVGRPPISPGVRPLEHEGRLASPENAVHGSFREPQAVEPGASNGRRLVTVGWFLLASGFLAMAFLGGTLQHAVYVVLAVFCFWSAEVAFSDRSRKLPATLILLAAGLCGLLLASGTFIPCAQAFFASRAAGDSRGQTGYPNGTLQPALNAFAYLFNLYPSLLGSPQTFDGWKLFKSDYFNVGYLGTIPFLLSFLALLRKTTPQVAKWLMLFGLIIPLTPLVGYLYHRVLLLFALGGAWALADFLTHASEAERTCLARRGLKAFGVVALFWAMASCALIFLNARLKSAGLSFVEGRLAGRQFGIYKEWYFDHVRGYIDSLSIWSSQHWPLLFLVLCGLVALAFRSSRRPNLWQAVFCATLAAELTLLGARAVTTVDPVENPPYKETPAITAIRQTVAEGRLYQGDKAKFISQTPLTPNLPSVFGIRHLNVYESIQPAGLWAAKGYSTAPEILGELGVSHLLLASGEPVPPRWNLLWNREGMQLFELRNQVHPIFCKNTKGRWISVQPLKSTMNSDVFEIGTSSALLPPLESSGRHLSKKQQTTVVIYSIPFYKRHPQIWAGIALLLGSWIIFWKKGSQLSGFSVP